jgi:hypothetical protein
MSELQRWLFGRFDPFLCGLMRLFFGISGICKFTGLTSPLPRLVQGGFELGLPLHRYAPGNFGPAALPGDWLPAPSYAQYGAVEVAALVVAVCVAAGLLSRLSCLLFAACCWWLLLVDPAGFKHNLFALACFGVLIAACPCGDRCSLDALLFRRPRRSRLVFPLRLVQVQVAVIYLFSTAVKLGDGWSTGHLLAWSAPKNVARVQELGFGWLAPLIGFRPVYAAFAWSAVAVEGFLVVGLLVPRLRWWALWLGVCLHLGIDLAVDVGSYSLTMFAVYVAFIDDRPRQTKVRAAPTTARWLRLLDWLARLDVVVDEGLGRGFVVDGGAARDVWWRLPLTFPVAFGLDQARALGRRLRR